MLRLVGQFDSPFVRRTAVAMNHYGIVFERVILSTFADFDATAVTYLRHKLRSLIDVERHARLLDHCDRCEAMDAFAASEYSEREAA
jgi:glutathione S-transferase